MIRREVDVLVVGGGPAGLAASVELKRGGAGRVIVIDREPQMGGIPRHCFHTGFGVFDLRRLLSGPSYARHRVALAQATGVELLPETSAIGWSSAPSSTAATGERTLRTTSPRGLCDVTAKAVLLATGCRERPRAARLVPGTRPQGIFTTGALQQLVHLSHERVGRRAVVVGAEHVSFSAVHTLLGSGTKVAAVLTELPAHQTFGLAAFFIATARGIPVLTGTKLTGILGARRVEAVEICEAGARRTIDCDTVVFTGDWIPDHELARLGQLAMEPTTRGPAVDLALRTSARGVFAAGNLLRGAETADVAALEGRAAARAILDFLGAGGGAWPAAPLPIETRAPLLWVSPNRIADGGGSPPRDRFVLRTRELVRHAELEVTQAGQLLHVERFRRLIPNRAIDLDAAWTARVRPAGGAIVIAPRARS